MGRRRRVESHTWPDGGGNLHISSDDELTPTEAKGSSDSLVLTKKLIKSLVVEDTKGEQKFQISFELVEEHKSNTTKAKSEHVLSYSKKQREREIERINPTAR